MEAATVVRADLGNQAHQAAILHLLNAYSKDPMGGGRDLSAYTRANLIAGLAAHPTTRVLLAYHHSDPVGIAICFLGFSTFAAKPLLNIHDFAVLPEHRGRGIGKTLLQAVERDALALDCCKLTLEVLEKNSTARRVYHAFGFNRTQDVEESGLSLFYVKPLGR